MKNEFPLFSDGTISDNLNAFSLIVSIQDLYMEYKNLRRIL